MVIANPYSIDSLIQDEDSYTLNASTENLKEDFKPETPDYLQETAHKVKILKAT